MMKLRYSPTSPYVRKAMIVALETGLADRIEFVPSAVWEPDTDIASDNPLGKVPALITEGGEVLYDSPVVCEYLDSLHDGRRLFPPTGGARWAALRRQALGDGMADATALRLIEERRKPDGQPSPWWIERQKVVVARSLDALEEEAATLGDPETIGHIAIACALGFLDFRLASEDWRASRPTLARWFAEYGKRQAFRETEPHEPT